MTRETAQYILDTQDHQPWHKVADARKRLGVAEPVEPEAVRELREDNERRRRVQAVK